MSRKNPSAERFEWLRSPRFWVGLGVSGLALYLAAKDMQWSQVGAVVSRANPLLLLLAVASYLVSNWAKTMRWRLLFYPEDSKLAAGKCMSILYVGQLANSVLSLRIGELARAYLIGESFGVGKVFALATTVVEKAMDSVLLLLFLAALSALMPLPPWLQRSSLLVSAAFAGLLVVVMITVRQRGRITSFLHVWSQRYRFLAPLRILERLVEASGTLRALHDVRLQLQLWGWSVLIWAVSTLTNQLVLWSIGLRVSPLAAPLLLVVLITGAILPASPLLIGVFHYLCVLTLSVFGVEQGLALSYGFLLHLVIYMPVVVVGLWGLWTINYDLGSLARVSRRS